MNPHNKQFAGSGQLVAATLRGYRCWSLGARKLKAVSQGVVWDTHTIKALCVEQDTSLMALGKMYINGTYVGEHEVIFDHKVPNIDCTCGVYGWYEPETALREHTSAVMGVVECKGTILLGSTGFRAQEAKIVAIAPGNDAKINEYVRNEINLLHWTQLDRFVYHTNGQMVVNYDELNAAMGKANKKTRTAFMDTLNHVGYEYGIEVFESMEALKLIYPPQLDTLENVLEGKLKRYAIL